MTDSVVKQLEGLKLAGKETGDTAASRSAAIRQFFSKGEVCRFIVSLYICYTIHAIWYWRAYCPSHLFMLVNASERTSKIC